MEYLLSYLITGGLLFVGIWLRIDDWREAERRHDQFSGALHAGGVHPLTGGALGATDFSGACGYDAGCASS